MRLLFLGSGAFGVPTLRHLAARHEVLGIVSQPDRRAGRGGKLTPTPVSAWAIENLPTRPLFRPESINEPGMVAALHDLAGPGRADAWVVIAFGQRLARTLVEPVFAINLHASLLPRWRGAAPINAAILAGDSQTGNSVITIAERMDAGLVLGWSSRPIYPALTAGELHDLLALDGPPLVERVLDEHARGLLRPEPQDEAGVTRAPKLSPADAWIDFTQDAEACRRRIHGLTPWPGVRVVFQDQPLKLLRAQPVPRAAPFLEPPGALLDPALGVVCCGPGSPADLLLIEVQPPGKKPMNWQDFARGRRIRGGERLLGAPRPC
ncbi:MAG TPA: methionyl-tRNA formyltransferase [Phycisphaerales bacterium]|nr:methionyl-tRNA formyltransferase [Phycisphaerales bacterium]